MITRSHTTTNNRAPKLHSLKYQAVFSETIGSVGIDDADFSPQVRPKVKKISNYLLKEYLSFFYGESVLNNATISTLVFKAFFGLLK